MPRKDPPADRIDPFASIRSRGDGRRRNRPGRAKLRSDIPGTDPLTREPKLTADLAMEFVKLLHAGIPNDRVLSYFAPAHFDALKTKERRAWLSRWSNSPLMAAAAAQFNKAPWQDLDKDSRLSIALDKHMAELAYYLYTSNYKSAYGPDLDKIIDARKAVMEFVKTGEGDTDTPFMRAMKDLLSGKVEGLDGPPRFGESIPLEKIKPQS